MVMLIINSPYTPVVGGEKKERLYGRGGADDGCRFFATFRRSFVVC
jgi:hypothetical protein